MGKRRRRAAQGFTSADSSSPAGRSLAGPTRSNQHKPSHQAVDSAQQATSLLRQGNINAAESLLHLAAVCGLTGRTEEMVALLRTALILRPDYPAALSNLGIALQDQGQPDEAAATYRQALTTKPVEPEALLGLSQALGKGGDLQAAIAHAEQALALRPDHAETHCSLGNLHKQAGRFDAAIAHYRQALELEPRYPEALVNLGNALKDQRNLDAAISYLNQALEIRPDFVEALSNLGIAHQENGDSQAAIAAYRRAIEIDPDFAPVHSNLGISLTEAGDLEGGIHAFRCAIALDPNFAEAHSNLGIALEESGDLEASLMAYHQALALQPNYPEAHCNLGNALQELGDIEGSLRAYRKAVALRPEYPDARKNLSMAVLLTGDYLNGWRAYEWRFHAEAGRTILNAVPQGEPCHRQLPSAGESLLLVSEQGFGDTLQFMRYVLPLRQRGLQVRLCAPSKLHSLIQVSGLDQAPLAPEEVHGREVGAWLPLLSLPGQLGVSADQPLVNQPYLRTTDELHAKWRRILANEQRPIIALNWQGNPEHEKSTSKGRSLPLETFAPLAQIEGIHFLALQKGPGSEQLDSCSFRDRFVDCQDLVSATWDFLETAAMIANCDLVISSDTAVAHLAAGVGKETWLLLKNMPEWRWGLEGERSAWYPSMRLFRQSTRGNWDELLQRLTEALRQRLAEGWDSPARPEDRRWWQASSTAFSPGPMNTNAVVPIEAPEDHYNLGVTLQQRGELNAAIEAYRRALALQPSFPEALGNMGVALQATGDLEGAIRSLQLAVTLRPEFSEALSNLGNAMQKQGDVDAAISAYQRALAIRPDFAEALSNLATAWKEKQHYAQALATCQRALELQPQYPEALSNLGNILQAQWQQQQRSQQQPHIHSNEDKAAKSRCSARLSLTDDQPAILCDLAAIQIREGDLAASIVAYKKALALKPDYANAHYNLGIAYKDQDRFDEAIQCYSQALKLKPDYAEAHTNLGNIWQELGDLTRAVAAYEKAIAYQPEHPAANKNLSMAWLLQGNYRQGWTHYAWRFRDITGPDLLFAHPATPQWDGSPLSAGEKLVLVGEQGLGDILQFMRYVRPLREQGLQVSLCAVEKLHGLIKASGIDASPLTPSQANRLEEGVWLPLLSLPGLLGVSAENPLVSDPYIHTNPEQFAAWNKRLSSEKRPIIAINWQGNPEHEITNSRGRSLPLDDFATLAAVEEITFLSLQKGYGSEQLQQCSFLDRFVGCQDEVNNTWDFLETAAIIANCDLVITSDTAVAHLAAGIGKPTWLLLKHVPEWRWGLKGDSTFWYPSMRLFRQRERGNWSELMQRVAEALKYEYHPIHPSSGNSESIAILASNDNQRALDSERARARYYLQHGRLSEAEDVCRRVSEADPTDTEALNQLGVICGLQGHYHRMGRWLRRSLALKPDQPKTLCNLALALEEIGDTEAAREFYSQAIRLKPDLALAHYHIGHIDDSSGRHEKAISSYLKSLQYQPDMHEALAALGNSHKKLGNYDAAIAAYERALKLKPNDPNILCNQGNSYIEKGCPEVALACYKRALPAKGCQNLIYHNMGIALHEVGELDAAIVAFEQSLAFDSDFAEAHGALAMARLLAGDYQRGWKDYEWRFQTQHKQHLLAAIPPLPRWDGSPLRDDQPLILVCEQGLGDTLQFMRYGIYLKRQGISVTICAPRKLHGLIRESGLDDDPLAPEQVNQLYKGVWLPLLSLPGLLGVSPQHPLINEPYLRSRNDLIEIWRERLAGEQRPIIAINWQGNPQHESSTSKGRSLPLEAFAPIAQLAGFSLLSLQKGAGSSQLESCSFRDRFVSCQYAVNNCWDFLETSAIIANCDLVISSDTAIAHLAAGMGKCTWVLLKHVPEWRWGMQGQTSFWYPSIRLFRQQSRGDWNFAIQAVRQAILRLLPDQSDNSMALDYPQQNASANDLTYEWIWSKLGERYTTLKTALQLLRSEGAPHILELGTTRSFRNGMIETSLYDPDPATWDWGAGCFTYACLALLPHARVTTVDNNQTALRVCQTLCKPFADRLTTILSDSTTFLLHANDTYQLVYMDHGEAYDSDSTSLLHLNDAKILLSRSLLRKDSLVLVDDVHVSPPNFSKGLYSIPFLQASGFSELQNGPLQALLRCEKHLRRES